MLLRLTLRTAHRPDLDISVDCPPDTTWADLTAELPDGWGTGEGNAVAGTEPVRPGSVLGEHPLVAGAVVHLNGAAAKPAPAGPDMVAVGGPAAGLRIPLRPGRQLVGRGSELRVPDPRLSRVHLEVDVGSGAVRVRDAGSTNGSVLEDEPLGQVARAFRAGRRLRAGHSVFEVRLPVRAVPVPAAQGVLPIGVAPRHLAQPVAAHVQVPPTPQQTRRSRFPLVAVLVPVAAAGVLAAVLGSALFLLFGLLSPIMLLSNMAADRWGGRAQHRKDLDAHRRAVAAARTQLDTRLREQSRRLHYDHPDADRLLQLVLTLDPRLWERQPPHPDFGRLRLGIGTVPAQVRVEDPEGLLPVPVLEEAPASFDLPGAGVLGIHGPGRVALAGFLAAQLAVLHSPRTLRLVLLSSIAAADRWRWVGWLPHVIPDAGLGGGGQSLTAVGSAQVGRMLADLHTLVTDRERTRQCGGPAIVVLLDGPLDEEHWPAAVSVLDRGPAVGVHAICLAPDAAALPSGCREQLRVDEDGRLRGAGLTETVADLPGPHWLDRLARGLAPLRDRAAEETGGVPDRVVLGELWPRPLRAAELAASWAQPDPGPVALLGAGAAGPVTVDLERDGPHALVAGTTGAGKSELLRTLVLSLALAQPPERVSFVLVDYKGGAAFGSCRELPHVVGTVTDLDPAGTERVITALRAELRRREGVLAEAGAEDLAAYRAAAGPGAEPLARLVVVVDEFRMLAKDHPDLLDGLVALATLGRSLGLHLVLATQRPAGVVGPEIRANVNLRIALRVQDGADSLDVLDDAAAARLPTSQRGRALLRVGAGPLTPVQVALAGQAGRRDITLTPVRLEELGPPRSVPEPGGRADTEPLVNLVAEAVALAGAEPLAPLWCPPLPERLPHRQIAADHPFALGLVDLPDEQRRRVWGFEGGNLTVCGAAGSGRRTLMRTLLRVLAAQPSAGSRATTCWVLDGAGGLGGEATLPNVGAVVEAGDGEHAERVLREVKAQLTQRHTGSAPSEPVCLLVHGWEEWCATWDEPAWSGCAELLGEVMRRGPAVAVHTVVTGGRAVLSGRLAAAVTQRLVLRQADPADAVLAGVAARQLPTHWPPGRALLAGPTPLLLQLAEPPDPPTRYRSSTLRLPPLPRELTSVDPPAEPGWIGLGRGGREVTPIGWSPTDPSTLLICGTAGSGRTAALATLAQGAQAAGVAVHHVGTGPDGSLPGTHWPGGQPPPAQLVDAVRGGLLLVDDLERLDPGWEAAISALPAGTRAAVAVSTQHAVARHIGLIGTMRRTGHGLLLGVAGPLEGEVFGLRLGRQSEAPPGRALRVLRGRTTRLQLRLASAQPDASG